jgi:hypothetical protein
LCALFEVLHFARLCTLLNTQTHTTTNPPTANAAYATVALHYGQPLDKECRARAPPIYASSSFVFEGELLRAQHPHPHLDRAVYLTVTAPPPFQNVSPNPHTFLNVIAPLLRFSGKKCLTRLNLPLSPPREMLCASSPLTHAHTHSHKATTTTTTTTILPPADADHGAALFALQKLGPIYT